jgi:hypothetical protein
LVTIAAPTTVSGNCCDRATMTPATMDGVLDVDLINGFQPALGNTSSVLAFGSRVGDFGNYQDLDVSGHLSLRHSFAPTSLVLTARPTIDGDINLDGTANIFDINSVSTHWGTSGPAGDTSGRHQRATAMWIFLTLTLSQPTGARPAVAQRQCRSPQR